MDSLIVMRRPIKKRTSKPLKSIKSKKASPREPKPEPCPSHTVSEIIQETCRDNISFVKLYNDFCLNSDKEINRRVKSAGERGKLSYEVICLRATRSKENLTAAPVKGGLSKYGKSHAAAKRGVRAEVMLEIDYTKDESKEDK